MNTSTSLLLSILTSSLAFCAQPIFAQTDDFNDGNDTSPVSWMRFDAINTITGGGSGPQDTWSFPGGNSYEFQAVPSPSPGTLGPARVSSFPSNIYSDFYASIDVVGWSNSYSQAFGLIGRAGNFSTPGSPTTRGYIFIYVDGSASAGRDNFIAIARLKNDAQTSGVHGTSGNTAELHGVSLSPVNQYRLVFIGHETHLEGRVYQLPDVTTPIAMVSANTTNETPMHTSGQCGLLAFNVASSGGVAYSGPVDVTFDNYTASADCPSTTFADDFNDGNDTTPPPAWVHYDPIGGVTAPPATFSFPSGAYRIHAGQPFAPGLGAGAARAAAVRMESSHTFSDFFVSVDVLDWDDTVRDVFGIVGRGSSFGLGSTVGYIFTYEMGSGSLPNTTGGGTDISSLVGEQPNGLPTTPRSGSVHLTRGRPYRMTFTGVGSLLTGKIYDLADTTRPVVAISATDGNYTRGNVAIVAASQGSETIGADATFDNFYMAPAEPRLTLDTSSSYAVISWSASLDCIWVLETTSALGPSAVWTEITADKIVFNTGQNVYTAALPISSGPDTFYRLRKL